jgi:hypothetical protein
MDRRLSFTLEKEKDSPQQNVAEITPGQATEVSIGLPNIIREYYSCRNL